MPHGQKKPDIIGKSLFLTGFGRFCVFFADWPAQLVGGTVPEWPHI